MDNWQCQKFSNVLKSSLSSSYFIIMPGMVSHQHAKAALVIGIIEVVLGVGLVGVCIVLNTIAKSSTNDIPASPFMNVGAVSLKYFQYKY